MNTTPALPHPCLCEGRFVSLRVYTDESLFEHCGVRIAFSQRSGGASIGAYDSLNIGSAVGDDEQAVFTNRARLREAFGASEVPCIIPKQVHGKQVLTLSSREEAEKGISQKQAEEGFDAIVVEPAGVAALLGFADCVPVIIVSPTGRFSVIHAGWRGVESQIVSEAIKRLQACDEADCLEVDSSHYNVYIGAHIGACCFETGAKVRQRFMQVFGEKCLCENGNINLEVALRISLARSGVSEDRIACVGLCTVCSNDQFFSYRAQDGVCGRHGAFAVRIKG